MLETKNIIDTLKSNDIVVCIDSINKLKYAVKNNFEKIEDVSSILDTLPFLKDDINGRIDSNRLFQPGRIVETIVIQSMSNFLNCSYKDNGIYENEKYILKQDGGSGKSDLTITDKIKNATYTFEIKEPIAYGKSCGFIYDDFGKPIEFTCRKNSTPEDAKYREYVMSLFQVGSILENYNILDNIGHNKLFETDNIITNNFDFIISYDKIGKLTIMTVEEYKNKFSFKIEIRSCGRNTRKVFTESKLNLKGNFVILKSDELLEITQRGGTISSRYKYIKNNATFSFKKKDVKVDHNGILSVNINNIKQHVGEVSIQHFRKK
jgi:hypothetical protein